MGPSTQRMRERLRGSRAELSWLMHTTYLSADTAGQAAKGMGEKEYKTMREAATSQPTVDDREAQIASIEVRLFVVMRRLASVIHTRKNQVGKYVLAEMWLHCGTTLTSMGH